MSLLDLVGDVADLFITRRLALAIGVGILGAIAAHAAVDDPLGTRVALLSGIAGLVAGIVWEYRHRHSHHA